MPKTTSRHSVRAKREPKDTIILRNFADLTMDKVNEAMEASGVTQSRFGAAVQTVITSRGPYVDYLNFDPHSVVAGTTETHYELWRRQYRENPYARSLPNIVKNLVMGSGFALKSTNKNDILKWERFMRLVNYEPILGQALLTALVFGNAYINLPPAEEYGIDKKAKIALQPLQPDHVWNLSDRRGRVVAFWYSPSSNPPPDYTVSPSGKVKLAKAAKGEIVMADDMFYLRFDLLGADIYGRPLGSSLENDLDQIELLEAVQYVMGHREAHGMVVFEVDTSYLNDTPKAGSKVSDSDKKLQEFSSKIKNQERFDVKTRNMRIASRVIVPTKLIPGPDGKMTKIGGIDIKPIVQNMDMKGINEAIVLRRQKLTMGYQIPGSFSGILDSASRGQSTGELTTFSTFLRSVWNMLDVENSNKILPTQGLSDKALSYNEIVSGKAALAWQNSSLIAQMPIFSDVEKRALIKDEADIDIDPEAWTPPKIPAMPTKGIVPPGGGKSNSPIPPEENNSSGVPKSPKNPKTEIPESD